LTNSRDAIRIKHYSYATQKTDGHWTKRDILFHNKRHPAEMGVPTIEAILSQLAQEGNLSASTQNQVFNAILFLYRNVLKIELATPIHALRAIRAHHLPTECSVTKVNQVLSGSAGNTPAHGLPAAACA
jgi:hypothetical protein